jgi:hypothetical protein
MRRTASAIALALIATCTAGCIGFEHQSTLAPTSSGVSALIGTWSSANIIPSASTCTDFTWNVTEQTPARASGLFSATCANDLRVSGTASGTLSGSLINWSAQGTANAPGLASCAVALSGTAELAVDSIRVPYSGDTCLGKVNGTEVLKRH